MCEHFAYFQAVATEDNVLKNIVFYTEKWIFVKIYFQRPWNYSIGFKEYELKMILSSEYLTQAYILAYITYCKHADTKYAKIMKGTEGCIEVCHVGNTEDFLFCFFFFWHRAVW